MTTNFYFAELVDGGDLTVNERTQRFIGKRSAAGLYCWGCGVTLCKAGEKGIHQGRGDDTFYEECPKCGLWPMAMKLSDDGNAGGVELGFAKPLKYRPREGVAPCASFTWHIQHEEVERRVVDNPEILIRDEYGREMTGVEFLTLVNSNCPIEFINTEDGWS